MRLQIRITGAVQGVGFRPHVYRLAIEHGLQGYVLNSAQGVLIEAQGPRVREFAARLQANPPLNAVVASFQTVEIPDTLEKPGTRLSVFSVSHSDPGGEPAAYLLPDLAMCAECAREIRSPANRRYRYPFTTCTHCGPRYSIVEGLPYDRPLTVMRHFPMCPACEHEYRDPLDRRFHAQTNCCRDCGPQLSLPLEQVAAAIRDGAIVALKGIGGFHLICRPESAALLRARKRRPTKPFAIMAPSLEAARALCHVSEDAARLLQSPQSPIVLLERLDSCPLPEDIAPGNPFIGVLLPYSPLHALLMDELGFPVIATSGNLSEEPIWIEPPESQSIADLVVTHNRPILRPVDDSIVRFIEGRAVLLRRARGYAPLPLNSPIELPELLATGAHMKNTVAFSRGRLVFLSQHLGDLSTVAALDSHRRAAADFCRTYDVHPERIVCDMHPDYGSTREGAIRVQHHEAHVLALMLEHSLEGPLLGVAWDGSGYGTDHTVWGGEFLRFDGDRFHRAAHLRPFRLPGGEQAVKEPRRSLLGVLTEMDRAEHARPLFRDAEWKVLSQMLDRGLNSPVTTSAGRLFDAAAALLGLCPVASFEGEAAMLLEFEARRSACTDSIDTGVDWQPLFSVLIESSHQRRDRARLFHNSLAGMITKTAIDWGLPRVLLTGGCFQNALLTELTAARLRQAGFDVFTHGILPPNDGAVAAGQIMAAALAMRVGKEQ